MDGQSLTFESKDSFKCFLLKNRRNRVIISLAGVAILIQFLTFKYFYPFTSYIHGDSFSYINAAEKNLDINFYLIGYSKFLRLFSVFNRTDYILAAFQYLFIQFSAIYFLFTLFYFHTLNKTIQTILLCFIIFNPLFLHLGNLISSDGFFLGLSLIWFTMLLWIIHRPSAKIIVCHAIVLVIALTVRYNAIIYPVISILAFGLSNMSFKRKLSGISLAIVFIASFVLFTMFKYKKLTGYWQYSPFSGWQLTNNAMYTYRYVGSADRKPVPKKFQAIDNMIRRYFDSTRDVKKFPVEAMQASTFYMWSQGQPMRNYQDSLFKNDTAASAFKKWATLGPFFKDYGLYIIKHYPLYFAKYFMWPNSKKYYAPPLEFLQYYNSGRSYVTEQGKKWFGYSSRKIYSRTENKVLVLSFYPILSGLINVVMICCILSYCLLKGWQYNNLFNRTVWISVAIWLLNAVFTIGASSAALRFQSFPIILTTIFVGLLLNWLLQMMSIMKQEKTIQGIVLHNVEEKANQVLIQ